MCFYSLSFVYFKTLTSNQVGSDYASCGYTLCIFFKVVHGKGLGILPNKICSFFFSYFSIFFIHLTFFFSFSVKK